MRLTVASKERAREGQSARENRESRRESRGFSRCEECLVFVSGYCRCGVRTHYEADSVKRRPSNTGGKLECIHPQEREREKHNAPNESPSICPYASTSSYSLLSCF